MLRALLFEITVVVTTLCAVGAITIVGRRRLTELMTELRPRLRESAPYIGLLATVLAINSLLRPYAQQLSQQIGWRITGTIEAFEGSFVAGIQAYQSELLRLYFSYVYVFGYVFILVFPILAYLALATREQFKRLTVAYSSNYALGLVCYILFIAFGPRNMDVAENLLYLNNPQYQFLTSAVNNKTNAFPSLHTSLSATVAIFAYKTRSEYPAWFIVGSSLAVSIIISTMYLGIHWATDVVFGILLAGLSVYIADRYVDAPASGWKRIQQAIERHR